jgi:hypothetical protein
MRSSSPAVASVTQTDPAAPATPQGVPPVGNHPAPFVLREAARRPAPPQLVASHALDREATARLGKEFTSFLA